MIKRKGTNLQGTGNSCSRSTHYTVSQEEVNEFEKELLEAIAEAEEKDGDK